MKISRDSADRKAGVKVRAWRALQRGGVRIDTGVIFEQKSSALLRHDDSHGNRCAAGQASSSIRGKPLCSKPAIGKSCRRQRVIRVRNDCKFWPLAQ
jgi:hypothetical protein